MLEDDAELDGEDLDGVDLTGAEADGVHLTRCTFRSVLLTGTRLGRVRMRGVRFESCDLSGALLDEAVLTDVAFDRCRMTGFVLSGRVADLRVTGCKLDDAVLRGITGSGVVVEDTTLLEADLQRVALTGGSRFDRCDLRGADVARSRVRGVRLTGCRLDGLRGASGLAGAVVDPTELVPLGMALLAEHGIVVEDVER